MEESALGAQGSASQALCEKEEPDPAGPSEPPPGLTLPCDTLTMGHCSRFPETQLLQNARVVVLASSPGTFTASQPATFASSTQGLEGWHAVQPDSRDEKAGSRKEHFLKTPVQVTQCS